MKQFFKNISPFILLLALISCEKVIDVEVPETAESIVIEGSIETDGFPLIIISRSQDYFSSISTTTSALADALVSSVNGDSVNVYVTVDGMEHLIPEVCLSNLPPEFQAIAEDLLGLDEIPPDLDICVYVDPFTAALVGQEGKTYGLRVVVNGEEYTATTRIPEVVRLDTLWYQLQPPEEGQGFIWTTLNDPDTLGNGYKMYSERVGVDNGPIPVPGGSFSDRFFDGEEFDFNFGRGHRFGEVENEDSAFFYATGDLVAVKFTSIDGAALEFWETADDAIAGSGNPFSTPIQIKSNISNGARGVWAGYAVSLDTIECIP